MNNRQRKIKDIECKIALMNAQIDELKQEVDGLKERDGIRINSWMCAERIGFGRTKLTRGGEFVGNIFDEDMLHFIKWYQDSVP